MPLRTLHSLNVPTSSHPTLTQAEDRTIDRSLFEEIIRHNLVATAFYRVAACTWLRNLK